MITSDNHVHTSFSTDSETPMETMVLAGIHKGLSSICFTDHMDYQFPSDIPSFFVFSPEEYFLELDRLAAKYASSIQIRRGVELGLKKGIAQECRQLSSSFPFDFIIGSTHLVDDMDPYYSTYWEGQSERQGILRYYETTLENIQSGIDFDVYGHIDYIIRYTPTQKQYREQGITNEAYLERELEAAFPVIDEILKQLIRSGRGIELNTAGFKYGMGHPHPHERILKRYRELGGELLSIGSDGHQPEALAYDFARVPELLRECGFRCYTLFQNRQPIQQPLS